MLRSLQTRLLLTYGLVIATVLAVVGVSLVLLLLRNSVPEERVYERLDTLATAFSASRLRQSLSDERLVDALLRLGLADARALVLGVDGRVLIDTLASQSLPALEILQEMVTGELPRRGRYVVSESGRFLYVSHALDQRRILVLIAPQPGLLRELGEDFFSPLMGAAGAGLLASMILAWLVARWVAAPLRRIAQAARAVAGGDYERRLALQGPAETRELAAAFNGMLGQVRESQQAMRDFVANVSHEMKTPLTSIQGFAQALVDGTARDEAGRRQAGRVIHEEAERLRRLVDDLLDLARLDAGQIEFERRPVDVAAILEAVLERQSVLAGKKSLHLIKRIGHPPTLIGDGDRLAQVFTNLIGNAIEHTPPGGEVGLVCEHEDGWVRVHVDDNGPGIPDDELNRIFERFYQVDKARQRGGGHGAGLGLAISNEIVRAHGGRLKAQSVVGRGSRFSVELPVVRSDDDTLVRVSPTA